MVLQRCHKYINLIIAFSRYFFHFSFSHLSNFSIPCYVHNIPPLNYYNGFLPCISCTLSVPPVTLSLFTFSHKIWSYCCCSVTKLCPTLRPRGLQHARLPCPSPSPRVCSDSSPLNRWCHPTISSSATHFSACPQSFPVSGSFPMSQLFELGG